jgi:hypothetical protein
MKKALLALAAVSAIAAATVTVPTTADARCNWGCGVGIGVGAAVLGGIVAGAVPPPGYAYGGYAPVNGYVAYNDYYGAAPVGCPGGYWARRPIYDRWDNQVGWSRPKFFCPY